MRSPFKLITALILTLCFVASEGRAGFNSGCTDETACNYDVNATVDDDTCEYTSCAGCTDELACNYDSSKTKNDNSCEFADNPCETCSWSGSANPADGSGTVVTADSDGDGICNGSDLCSDTSKCNYDANPTEACVDPVEYYHDEDGDSIGDYSIGSFCSGDVIPGSSTTTLDANGAFDNCTDNYACNYDAASNEACDDDADGDGVCDLTDLCSNPNVPNFDADTDGDGIPDTNEACCEDLNNNNYCDDREIFGCKDSAACNYFVHANVDDGSCKYHTASTSMSNNEGVYQQTLEDSECDSCTSNGATVTITNEQMTANGLSSTSFTIGLYDSNDADDDDVCDSAEQVGCDDPNACNYGLDESGSSYSQAVNAYGVALTTSDNDGDGTADPLLITESCAYDVDLGYGVTPQGDTCTNFCKYDDACGVCGGTGVDEDGDGVCDDVDSCLDMSACNYSANPTEACQTTDACGVCGGTGVDVDGDGICDDNDSCVDTTACNYAANPTEDCQTTDACGVCGGTGVDVDGDGLCDDDGNGNLDNCTDTSKCNYDVTVYPTNPSCLEDINPANGICDDYEVTACGDSNACNYMSEAAGRTVSDLTLCLYASGDCEACAGNASDGTGYIVLSDIDGDGVCDDSDQCEDITACNFNANPTEDCGIDADENGVCDDNETDGCKDASACNYNASATREPTGACVYATGCQSCSGATDGTGTVVNNDDDFDGVCNDVDNCSHPSACNYVASVADSNGTLNGACENAEAGKNCSGDCLADADLDGLCDENDLCIDLAACNFDDTDNLACIYRNTCGVCGESTPGVAGFDAAVYCDCDQNVLDVLGNCGGGCEADVDEDGICDDVDPCLEVGAEPDECGVCDGPGAIYECGCFELPDDACSCTTSGSVTYPALGEDCDGFCLFDSTMVEVNGVLTQVCTFYDNAEITQLPDGVLIEQEVAEGGSIELVTDFYKLYEWMTKIDSLHHRMSTDLDDGSLTGASQRLTIEEQILDKGDLTVRGETRLSGDVQMDEDLVILGNLVVEQDATIKGTTFSLGGIETTSLQMAGDLSVGGSAVIDSTLEVMDKTLLQDTLAVYGDLLVGRDHVFTVDTFGNTKVNGTMRILETLDVSSDTRLADLEAANTSLGTLTSQGNALLKSDVDIHGNTTIDGTLEVENDATLDSRLSVLGTSDFTGAIASTSINNTGEITSGSINNSTSLTTNSLTVNARTTTRTLEVQSNTNIQGNLTVSNGSSGDDLFIVTNNAGKGLLNIPGRVEVYNTSADIGTGSPTMTIASNGSLNSENSITATHFVADDASGISTLNGQLQVGELASLKKGLKVEVDNVSGAAFEVDYDASQVEINAPTVITSNATFSGSNVTINNALTVSGSTNLSGITAASLDVSGAMEADGLATLRGNIKHTGSFLRTSGQLVVGSSTATPPVNQNGSSSASGEHLAFFDAKSAGLRNGLAIKVANSGTLNNSESFATFYKSNGEVAGRIEGESSSDWTANRGKKLDYDEHVVATTQAWAEATRYGAKVAVKYALATGKTIVQLAHAIPDSWVAFFPSIDWGDIPGAIYESVESWAEAGEVTTDLVFATASAISESAYMGVWNNINETEWGVAYATGDGDYAEWMPKLNTKEDYFARQIVGVKNGSISLNTADFDHLMVISTAPAVLGNMPSEELIADYEKVAFLGQVPVDVIGRVNSGDFIIPSGDNDGFGIAVDPVQISAEQIKQIVGVAWSDGANSGFNTVNVAVGLDHTATAQKFLSLKNELGTLRLEVDEIYALLMDEGVDRSTSPLTEKRPFFKRLFKNNSPLKLNGDEANADIQTAELLGATVSKSQPTMLKDMSKADILMAVEDTRNGNTPEAWKNANTQEVSEVIQTVVEVFVEEANKDALLEAETLRDNSLGEFMQRTEFALDNFSSLEEVLVYQRQQLSALGISPTEFQQMENEFVGRMLDSELSAEKIRKVVRTMEFNNPYFENIRPGTQAEARFVKQLQTEMMQIFEETAPQVAENMPLLKQATAGSIAQERIPTMSKPRNKAGVNSMKSLK